MSDSRQIVFYFSFHRTCGSIFYRASSNNFGCKVTDNKGDNGETGRTALQFYCPDGAPALAAAGLFGNETLGTDDITMNYHVISADKIASTVLKTTKKADVAILPVNAAAKICGTGEDKILNFFIKNLLSPEAKGE